MVAGRPLYGCRECGYETHKWMGRCPGCGSWNTIEETVLKTRRKSPAPHLPAPAVLKNVPAEGQRRITVGIGEFDRVLGGGAVPGSVVLLGGDPGIGKSTLLLQVAGRLSGQVPVLYVSGEESTSQLKSRSLRLAIAEDLLVFSTTRLDHLLDVAENTAPAVLIVDSVQSFYLPEEDGVPGSVVQVRQVTAELVKLAKEKNMIVFLVGHVTKEGALAGPRLLEHMVDLVLYLEGDRYHHFRVLRGVKNRFGSTNEIGVFRMEERGLMEVVNPSRLFVSRRSRPLPGAMITASVEGTRPLLVEIQSLVAPSNYPSPRRTAAGIDLNRVALIMAVLEKHASVSFMGLDTFVNVVGGVRLMETAADLALALSLVSSLRNKGLPPDSVAFGEVGLTGEVLPVGRVKERIHEGTKLGFKTFIIPRLLPGQESLIPGQTGHTRIIQVDNIVEAVSLTLSRE